MTQARMMLLIAAALTGAAAAITHSWGFVIASATFLLAAIASTGMGGD